jgi:hypothetical protein
LAPRLTFISCAWQSCVDDRRRERARHGEQPAAELVALLRLLQQRRAQLRIADGRRRRLGAAQHVAGRHRHRLGGGDQQALVGLVGQLAVAARAEHRLRGVKLLARRRVQQARLGVVRILVDVVGVGEHFRDGGGEQARAVEQRRIAVGRHRGEARAVEQRAGVPAELRGGGVEQRGVAAVGRVEQLLQLGRLLLGALGLEQHLAAPLLLRARLRARAARRRRSAPPRRASA